MNGVSAIGIKKRPRIGHVIDDLVQLQLPHLDPKEKEVLVKIHASAINLDDIFLMQGTSVGFLGCPQPSQKNPYVPGMDFAGIVEMVGTNVTGFNVGDAVFGVIFPNRMRCAWETEAIVEHQNLFHIPEGIDYIQASAYGTSALAAYIAVSKANILKDNRCLVIGASGGVGNVIVKMLKAKGANVVGVCSTKNIPFLKEIGADKVIDYTENDYENNILAESGVDRVFDCIGGKDIEKIAFRILKTKGIFITLVGPQKNIGMRKLNLLQFIGMLLYTTFRSVISQLSGSKYILVSTPLIEMNNAVSFMVENEIDISVENVIPFDLQSINEAITHVYSRQTKGKTIIKINGMSRA